MQIRKFYATSIPSALRDIRKHLGADAVILSTRQLAGDDMKILSRGGRARFEVTAARELPEPAAPQAGPGPALPQPPPQPPRPAAVNPLRKIAGELRALREELSTARPVSGASAGPVGEPSPHRPFAKAWPPVPPPVATRPPRREALPPAGRPEPVRREPAFRWRFDSAPGDCAAAAPVRPVSAVELQAHLRGQGVEEALARRILDRMFFSDRRADAAPWRPEATNRNRVEGGMAGSFDRLVRVVGDFLPPGRRPPREDQRRLVLVGPTGVGKTTTLAKIASRHALGENRRVGLITLDTYRVAAVEQLKTYARLLDVPIEVARDSRELAAAFARFSDRDLVLVDTPGHSPRDREALQRLAAVLDTQTGLETHLVIPSGLRPEEIRGTREAFRIFRYGPVIFSKVDEATVRGPLLNAWILDGLEVSYLTTGQRVPEDLEDASAEWLCRSVLRGPA